MGAEHTMLVSRSRSCPIALISAYCLSLTVYCTCVPDYSFLSRFPSLFARSHTCCILYLAPSHFIFPFFIFSLIAFAVPFLFSVPHSLRLDSILYLIYRHPLQLFPLLLLPSRPHPFFPAVLFLSQGHLLSDALQHYPFSYIPSHRLCG